MCYHVVYVGTIFFDSDVYGGLHVANVDANLYAGI